MSTLTSSPPPRANRLPAAPAFPFWPLLAPLMGFAIISGAVIAWLNPGDSDPEAVSAARFVDATAESGVNFRHRPAGDPTQPAPTTLTGGVICADFNQDGAPDLFFINGGQWPWEVSRGVTSAGQCALFLNEGDGRFVDASSRANLDLVLNGVGAAAGDYDGDGDIDLFITAVGSNRLYQNNGYAVFADVTDLAGVGGDEHTWSSSACWIDIDGDRKLDLVVAHYAHWPAEVALAEAFVVAEVGRSYSTPTGFLGRFPTVFRNEGNGHFSVVADSAGLTPRDPATRLPASWPLAVIPLDADNDGAVDLAFTFQDSDPQLFLHQGSRFAPTALGAIGRHEGSAAGLAASASWPMGYGGDADPRARAWVDLLARQPRDEATTIDLAPRGGVILFDADLDGRIEWVSGESRAEARVSPSGLEASLSGMPSLYSRIGDRWAPAPLADPDGATNTLVLQTRGMATGDFDGDGDEDLVLVDHGGAARVLRNVQRHGLPWLAVDLRSAAGGRDVEGARVEVHTPRGVLVRTHVPATSLFSQSDSVLRFGLGRDARVRKVVVEWPGGRRQEVLQPPVNQRLLIQELANLPVAN